MASYWRIGWKNPYFGHIQFNLSWWCHDTSSSNSVILCWNTLSWVPFTPAICPRVIMEVHKVWRESDVLIWYCAVVVLAPWKLHYNREAIECHIETHFIALAKCDNSVCVHSLLFWSLDMEVLIACLNLKFSNFSSRERRTMGLMCCTITWNTGRTPRGSLLISFVKGEEYWHLKSIAISASVCNCGWVKVTTDSVRRWASSCFLESSSVHSIGSATMLHLRCGMEGKEGFFFLSTVHIVGVNWDLL